MTDFDLATRFLLQLVVILMACRAVGWLGQTVGQAQVVCEMIAGVILGPSLFGLMAPEAFNWLFPNRTAAGSPHPSMSILYVFSQVGIVLYMFVVGMDFRLEVFAAKAKSAILVAVAGLAAPFALGFLAMLTFDARSLYGPGVSPYLGATFVGAAMCVTAFPVMARILYERGMASTPIGTLALSSGALADAAAWCLLAVILTAMKADPRIALYAIGGGAALVVIAILGRPVLARLERWTVRERGITPPIALTTLTLLMLCAWYSDTIQIFSVFGAFIFGAAMPRGMLSEGLKDKLGPVTNWILLPVFFVYTGLNTRVDQIDGARGVLLLLLVLVPAIAGKLVGCMVAARAGGESWRDAAIVGALMNSRGLMELVMLNIGIREGVIGTEMYTLLVVMAIVTTVLTTPLVAQLAPLSPRRSAHEAAEGRLQLQADGYSNKM